MPDQPHAPGSGEGEAVREKMGRLAADYRMHPREFREQKPAMADALDLLREADERVVELEAQVAELERERDRQEAQGKVIERVRLALRALGYAVAVHGSRDRDLDLIAAPWVEDAEPSPYVICGVLREAGFDELGMGAVESPHGRLGFALHGVPAAAGIKYIDLSVLLPRSALERGVS